MDSKKGVFPVSSLASTSAPVVEDLELIARKTVFVDGLLKYKTLRFDLLVSATVYLVRQNMMPQQN